MSRWVRLTVTGRKHVPKRQPVLFVLANHAACFDQPIVVPAAGDTVTMLATASNFARIINPKRWVDVGAYICLFPEGSTPGMAAACRCCRASRSWSGC